MLDTPQGRRAVEAAARGWCGSEFFLGTSDPDTYERLPAAEKLAHQHYARAGIRAFLVYLAENAPDLLAGLVEGAVVLTPEEREALLASRFPGCTCERAAFDAPRCPVHSRPGMLTTWNAAIDKLRGSSGGDTASAVTNDPARDL
jgi:hypothetical protein